MHMHQPVINNQNMETDGTQANWLVSIRPNQQQFNGICVVSYRIVQLIRGVHSANFPVL